MALGQRIGLADLSDVLPFCLLLWPLLLLLMQDVEGAWAEMEQAAIDQELAGQSTKMAPQLLFLTAMARTTQEEQPSSLSWLSKNLAYACVRSSVCAELDTNLRALQLELTQVKQRSQAQQQATAAREAELQRMRELVAMSQQRRKGCEKRLEEERLEWLFSSVLRLSEPVNAAQQTSSSSSHKRRRGEQEETGAVAATVEAATAPPAATSFMTAPLAGPSGTKRVRPSSPPRPPKKRKHRSSSASRGSSGYSSATSGDDRSGEEEEGADHGQPLSQSRGAKQRRHRRRSCHHRHHKHSPRVQLEPGVGVEEQQSGSRTHATDPTMDDGGSSGGDSSESDDEEQLQRAAMAYFAANSSQSSSQSSSSSKPTKQRKKAKHSHKHRH
jgi:hypothetical protein